MTQRLTLRLGDQVMQDWTEAEITRDLEEIAGGFRVDGLDTGRARAALPGWWRPDITRGPIRPGERVEIALDGEVVLMGWLDAVEIHYGPEKLLMTLIGRDATGDLVDCAAAPEGPAEYSNLNLTEISRRLCAPFNVPVTADVDVGRPFPRFGLEVGESVMSAVEKACRQREVLAVSDGVGGLRLTRGGRNPGPAPLVFGENILTAEAKFDHEERFRDYIVKGQSKPGGSQPMNAIASPLTAAPPERRPAPTSPAGARPGIVMTGRARDEAVTRYRPLVRLAKTQSGGASVQEQADWRMRTRRARAEELRITVADWRAGEERRLWRPNERVLVADPLSGVSHELLVACVIWRYGATGARTELKLCGPEAFDVLREGGTARPAQPVARNSMASELTRDDPPPRTATPQPRQSGQRSGNGGTQRGQGGATRERQPRQR